MEARPRLDNSANPAPPTLLRGSIALLCLTVVSPGCTEPRLPVRALPHAATATTAAPIIAAAPPSARGEQLTWAVSWRGLALGHATLAIPPATGATITTTGGYRSHGLAARFGDTVYRLTSIIDVATGLPVRSQVVETAAGLSTRIAMAFAPTGYRIDVTGEPPRRVTRAARHAALHSVDTALAALRRWVASARQPAHLELLHLGHRYRLEVARPRSLPLSGRPAYRIDCRGIDRTDPSIEPIALSLWLSAGDDTLPLRIEVADPSGRLVADLVDNTISLDQP